MRIELGNLYFDAERFEDAARWYEQALAIEPRNVSASTDLGISYYYMNQPDRALQQFDRSLAIDPRHTKTLLNLGIVRAFGKDDLEGAAQAWQRVVEYAPDSPEGKRAKQALEACATRIRTCRAERVGRPNLQGRRLRPRPTRTTSPMVLRLLQLLLILAIVRAVWRLAKGVLEGAGYQSRRWSSQRAKSASSWCAIPSAARSSRRRKRRCSGLAGETLYFCSDKCRREWERR